MQGVGSWRIEEKRPSSSESIASGAPSNSRCRIMSDSDCGASRRGTRRSGRGELRPPAVPFRKQPQLDRRLRSRKLSPHGFRQLKAGIGPHHLPAHLHRGRAEERAGDTDSWAPYRWGTRRASSSDPVPVVVSWKGAFNRSLDIVEGAPRWQAGKMASIPSIDRCGSSRWQKTRSVLSQA